MPQGDALLLMLLRYPQELVDPADYKLPEGKPASYRVTAKEMDMAKQLIGSMSGKWAPDEFHDEFRARLEAVIRKKMKSRSEEHTSELQSLMRISYAVFCWKNT